MAKRKINKDIEERKRKVAHFAKVSNAKKEKSAGGGGGDYSRKPASRLSKDSFLIVCEGKNTEPQYFDCFKLRSANIEVVGEGYNTVSLVKRAIKIIKEKKVNGKEYDQVWCVFDKDDFKKNDFNAAIELANKHGISVGYSNQAFEYWIILHFNDHQGGGMHRKNYGKMINLHLKKFGLKYEHKGSKSINEEMFNVLQLNINASKITHQDIAIERARRNHKAKLTVTPADNESCTTVYLLVEEIMKNL